MELYAVMVASIPISAIKINLNSSSVSSIIYPFSLVSLKFHFDFKAMIAKIMAAADIIPIGNIAVFIVLPL